MYTLVVPISDQMMINCSLSQWAGAAKRCRWCNSPLPLRRTRWCSDTCSNQASVNHWFSFGREVIKRDGKKKCKICGRSPVEVDHITPAFGKHSKASCVHHLSNLQLLCKNHHLQKTRLDRKKYPR